MTLRLLETSCPCAEERGPAHLPAGRNQQGLREGQDQAGVGPQGQGRGAGQVPKFKIVFILLTFMLICHVLGCRLLLFSVCKIARWQCNAKFTH